MLLIDAWLSLVERCVRDAEVAGSNPVASTLESTVNTVLFYFHDKIHDKYNKRMCS